MAYGERGTSPEYEPLADAVVYPSAPTPAEYLEALPLKEKRQIVDEVVNVGVDYHLATGQAPSFANLDSINKVDSQLLRFSADQFVGILNEGCEANAEELAELEQAYQAWVEVDAQVELNRLEAARQELLAEIEQADLPDFLFQVKDHKSENGGREYFLIKGSKVSDDEKIKRYHRFCFGKEVIYEYAPQVGYNPDERFALASFKMIHGFGLAKGREGASFFGEISKALGDASRGTPNMSGNELKQLAEQPEWVDLIFPELRQNHLDYLAWAGNYEDLERHADKRQELVAAALRFYLRNGDLPKNQDMKERNQMGRGLLKKCFSERMYIFHEQILLEVARQKAESAQELAQAA